MNTKVNKLWIIIPGALLLIAIAKIGWFSAPWQGGLQRQNIKSKFSRRSDDATETAQHTQSEDDDDADSSMQNAAAINNSTTALPLVYAQNPKIVAATFASCMQDPTCHVLYLHIRKTGGSYLASRLHPALHPDGEKYQSSKWCCGEPLMSRFRERPEHYCGLKLGIYEFGGRNVESFADVVQTCLGERRQRTAALITVRDPLGQTVSNINHKCNKAYVAKRKRASFPEEEREACRRCSYDDDAEFYDRYFNNTNEMYLGLSTIIPELTGMLGRVASDVDGDGNNDGDGGKELASSSLLVLDSSDISAFLADVERRTNVTFPKGRGNTGNTRVCDFQPPDSMGDELYPAVEVYNSIIGGEGIRRRQMREVHAIEGVKVNGM